MIHRSVFASLSITVWQQVFVGPWAFGDAYNWRISLACFALAWAAQSYTVVAEKIFPLASDMGKPTKMPVAMKSMKSKGVQKGKASKGKASKAKASKTKVKAVDNKPTKKIGKASLRLALQADMKSKSGRSDLQYNKGSEASIAVATDIPVRNRAGYPVKLQEGAVDPAEWRTARGVMGPVWHCHLQGVCQTDKIE